MKFEIREFKNGAGEMQAILIMKQNCGMPVGKVDINFLKVKDENYVKEQTEIMFERESLKTGISIENLRNK